MQRTLAVVSAALIGIASASSAVAAPLHTTSSAASAGWVSTKTLGFASKNLPDLGAVPASMPMKIVVGLGLRDRAGADAALRHISTPGDAMYHHFYTPASFTAAFGPTSAQVGAVVSYLNSAGFHGVSAAPNGLVVRAEGSAAVVENAFATSIHAFTVAGRPVFANVSDAKVPAALGSTVVSVLGLNSLSMHTMHRPQNVAPVAPLALRKDASAKGLPLAPLVPTVKAVSCTVPVSGVPCGPSDYEASPIASNTAIAVMTEGDQTQTIKDLRENEYVEGLRQVPAYVVPVDLQSSDTSGLVEWQMDTQTSTGIAGDVKALYLYNAGSLSDQDISMDFNRWVTDDVAPVANASFGECEYQAELDGAMFTDDLILLQAADQGQTLFASSGDSGSSCGFTGATNGVPASGPPQVEYPAASPYAMGAGGTTVFANANGTYFGSIPWNAGGGGVSLFEPPAFWQYGANPVACLPVYCTVLGPGLPVAITGGSGRTVPDVAMDADFLLSAADFYSGGTATSNGGTSLASPLSVGVFARLQSRHNNTLGHAGPALYAAYARAGGSFMATGTPAPGQIDTLIGPFHDIEIGSDGVWTAKPGYDFTTGMGSFDINQLIIAFGS
jgi:subtilase family serine protease